MGAERGRPNFLLARFPVGIGERLVGARVVELAGEAFPIHVGGLRVRGHGRKQGRGVRVAFGEPGVHLHPAEAVPPDDGQRQVGDARDPFADEGGGEAKEGLAARPWQRPQVRPSLPGGEGVEDPRLVGREARLKGERLDHAATSQPWRGFGTGAKW
ncbi:hypothetical protein D3C87_1608830 [compost metagenome]